MQLQRTTLRIKEHLKKAAELKALEENTTLQNIFNKALAAYLAKDAKKKAKKLVFKSFDLGVPLDNLTRDNYYDDPI